MEAGRRAKEATAYAAAQGYLITALNSFKGDIWIEQYELAFALHEEIIEVEYLAGNIETSEGLIDIALPQTKSVVEKAKLYHILVLIYTLQAQYEEAMQACRDALAILNVTLPEDRDGEAAYEAALTIEVNKIAGSLTAEATVRSLK